ncbi:MAG: acyl-CoA/acyl-ACP dehydrogenase [Burkholderiales bacterium]|nr:acyl-CoA/acyl-ACP dehydrogenase [Burkholderiales bacterium]
MDFSLNDEQREWQQKARKFAEEDIRPVSLARDRILDPRETWDWDLFKKGSQLGFRTLAVPKAYGGPGADFVTQALVMAELARGDSAISKAFSQNWKWSHLIASACSPEQKQRFLSAFLADDTFVMGKGITEPNAGSDNRLPPEDEVRAGVRLKAERRGDEWILNGEKCFIANGNIGKLFFLDARSNPNASLKEGVTMFLIPRDTPGFRSGKVFNKSGWRFYQNAEMIFDNARVPHANVVEQTGGQSRLDKSERTGGDLFGDLELAANALGVCMCACESALKLTRSRTQGGKPLLEQQAVQLKLGRMNMLTEALRSYVLRVAWEHDQKLPSTNAGFVMNFSTDVIQEVTQINMDLHGAAGFTMDALANKLVRDGIIWTHLAGDAVQRMKVVRRMAKATG